MEELKAWSKDKLATYKIPKEITYIKELPRNVMGKVTKNDVKKFILSSTASVYGDFKNIENQK